MRMVALDAAGRDICRGYRVSLATTFVAHNIRFNVTSDLQRQRARVWHSELGRHHCRQLQSVYRDPLVV